MQVLSAKDVRWNNDGNEAAGSGNDGSSQSDGKQGRQGSREVFNEDASEGNSIGSGEGAMGRQGCVYFIETSDGAFVKIGYSIQVRRRLHEIGRLLPGLRLIGQMPGTLATERWLHTKFAAHRERGEWFRVTHDLRDFITHLGLIEPPKPETHKIRESNSGKRSGGREGKKAMIAYFSPKVSKTLGLMAIDEETTMQALIGEAIDILLESRGKQRFEER